MGSTAVRPGSRSEDKQGFLRSFVGVSFVLKQDRVIAVGTPVARCPPHRSRRAVFPHRAPQKDSLPQKTLPSSSLFPSVRLAWVLRHGRPDQVSCVGCVFLSAPSPCERLSRPLSTTSRSDSLQTIGSLLSVGFAYLSSASMAFPRLFRLRLTSVSGFPLLWRNIRLPCSRLPVTSAKSGI